MYASLNSQNSIILKIQIQTLYWYDASGERTVKASFDNEGVYINGALSGARTGTSKFTAYISPYMVVSQGGNYTKHVYMGSQRITSKVSNSGIFGTSPVNTTELQAKYEQQTTKIKERFDSLGVAYSGLEQTGGLVSLNPPAGDIGGSYFYHPDHLGSSSLITDATGALVQHIQYVPFGEVFLEQRNASWNTPYKFNGKELDEETGLAYYHARYYDPRTSVWLSVDPLKGKTLNVSAYVYCYNNPVRYIDPDGRYSTEKGANISRWFYNLFHKNDAGPVFKNLKSQYGYEITGINESGEFQKGYAYGRKGYKGKQSSSNNESSSGGSRQKAGSIIFGPNREQAIDWLPADHIEGCIDLEDDRFLTLTNDGFVYTAKIFQDYLDGKRWTEFKAGVEMDLPEIDLPYNVYGVVDSIIGTGNRPYVYWHNEEGEVNYFNANGYNVGDTIYKDNGKKRVYKKK